MGDPLSIAASIAGLITISAQIVGIAKEVFDKVKDAPETVMRVREEVESMQPIFCQMHLLLNGSGSELNRCNLTMISIHSLMATLTGCVIVFSRLEKKVNGVCGFGDPTSSWRRVGVIADRVKWGLWRHEEVLVIIEDLQRQKLSLNLMLTMLSCNTTTEASENIQVKLQEHTTEILQSNHAHSALLRELISRQEEQARVLENIQSSLGGTVGPTRQPAPSTTPPINPATTIPTTLFSASSAAPSTTPSTTPSATPSTVPSTGRRPSSANSGGASIMSRRSTVSLRPRLDYLEYLKVSRAYKRLRHFSRGIDVDSSAESVFSYDSGSSTGHWSLLSGMTLGDLSVSQIAVLNLPIDLADISNPEPFQVQLPMETPSSHRRRRLWSSRGRIHNAIETGNEFVVKTVLAMGMDVEELDSNGRTPLVHAIMKHQEAICKLLLEKGACASVEVLKSFTSGMDFRERSALLDPLITRAMGDGACSVYVGVLRLLVHMALGINYGDDSRSSSQSMISVAIDMGYELAVHAMVHLEPRIIVGVDTEGQTPLVYAIMKHQEAICKLLLEKGASIPRGNEALLAHASQMLYNVDIHDYELLEDICEALLDGKSNVDIKTSGQMATARIAASMHDLVNKSYRSILQLLSLIESYDAEGWTPLASAAFNNNEALCEFLVEKGCSLYFDITQEEQLKLKLSGRIHGAAKGGYKTALHLLLDMGADINGRNLFGGTALLEAIYYNHLSCVKMLIERGADTTISKVGGISVLHRAAYRSTGSEMMKFLLDVVEARELINAKDSAGYTALHNCSYNETQHAAARLGNAKLLLQAGALLTIKNNDGRTPYELSRAQGRKELAKYLWSQLSPEQQAQETPPPLYW